MAYAANKQLHFTVLWVRLGTALVLLDSTQQKAAILINIVTVVTKCVSTPGPVHATSYLFFMLVGFTVTDDIIPTMGRIIRGHVIRCRRFLPGHDVDIGIIL